MTDKKYLEVAEFRKLGYLQELNRCFLHPLGLAIEVIVEDDGTERFGRVWDCRDDPEGIIFGPGMIDRTKALRIEREKQNKSISRIDKLGYHIQPTIGKRK